MPDSVVLPLTAIRLNPENPNVEDAKTFNALVRSVQRTGFVVPLQVWKLPDDEVQGEVLYEVIGGEHRYRTAQVLGLAEVPCVVIEAVKTRDDANALMIALNQIHGGFDREKLVRLAAQLVQKYGQEAAQQMMGFGGLLELDRLFRQVKKQLTPEQQKELEKRRTEIRTVDDLTLIVNEIMTKHGRTVPLGFVFFHFGGKTHLMVEMTTSLRKELQAFTRRVAQDGVHIADALEDALVAYGKD